MFIESSELLNLITDISNKVEKSTNGRVVFEEYVALPYYGNVILRFDLKQENYTIDDVDLYEREIYKIVGQDFLADFIGSVYRKVGVDYSCLEKTFSIFASLYKDEPIIESKYGKLIKNDAIQILQKCGYDCNLKIWEIQCEDEIGVYVLGQKSKKLNTVQLDKPYCFYETDESKCEALIKAAFFAKRNNVSLGRLMLDAQPTKE